MADAQHDDADQHRVLAAQEKMATYRTKLERYRAALDAGTDRSLSSNGSLRSKPRRPSPKPTYGGSQGATS